MLDVLERFARKEASLHEMMRALASHDGFFVPIGFATRLGRSEFDRIVMLSQKGAPPPGEVYVFSQESCLDLVQREPLGSFVTPVAGAEWLCALEDYDVKVKINPGGPLEHFFYVGKDAVPLARLWGRALRLEALLSSPERHRVALNAALRTFEAFTLLVLPNGSIATAQGMGGFKNPAMVFTSPDSFERMLPQVPTAEPTHLTGKDLFEVLPRAGVDGLVFNPLGPGVQASFPLSVVTQVLQLS